METTIVKAFELVMILCKKFNIDESHSLKHSMEVYNFALRIYESELPMNAYLEEQKDIIVLAAILHDTIDKKYVAEADGIEEIRQFLEGYVSTEKLGIIFQIITTMSYSTVKKNGFPLLGDYQLAYHIVRCIMYSMYTKNANYLEALDAAIVLFEHRVFRHRKDRLFVTNYSKKLSVKLHKKAKKDVEVLVKNIKF